MYDSPAIRVFLSIIAVAAVIVAIRKRALADWLPAGFFSCFALGMWFHQSVFTYASLAFSVLWVLAATRGSSRAACPENSSLNDPHHL